MEKNKVRLVISGLDYYLSTDEEVAYMKKLGESVDDYISGLLGDHQRLSQVQASVLCALNFADKYNQSQKNLEYLKSQIQVYLEDAAKAKTEAEMARRESERMTRDLKNIRQKLQESKNDE